MFRQDQHHALREKGTGLAMMVHRVFGPGFLELVYLDALLHEFRSASLQFKRKHRQLASMPESLDLHFNRVNPVNFI